MGTKDKINPEHYRAHGILKVEPIVMMKNSMTEEAYRGYLIGCVLKYVSRYDMKDGLYDLGKAKKYIEFLEADLQGFDPLYAQNKMKE